MIIATWAVRAGDVRVQRLGFQDTSELSKQVYSREKILTGQKIVIGKRAGPVKRNLKE